MIAGGKREKQGPGYKYQVKLQIVSLSLQIAVFSETRVSTNLQTIISIVKKGDHVVCPQFYTEDISLAEFYITLSRNPI